MKRKWLFIIALLSMGAAAATWGSVVAARRVGVFQGYAPEQPIHFPHKLHAGKYEIPCLYCHFAAERSRHAGIPPLNVCMNCHGELKKQTPEIEKLKEAVALDRPVHWIKVHNLPDFVYFNHSQHVTVGIECQECHGRVETMEVVRQEKPLTMGWCIDCHRQHGITEFSEPGSAHPKGAEARIGGMDCGKCHY